MENNCIHIRNICNYLEEIGIIDQISINSFLKLYSYAISKTNENNYNNRNPNNNSSTIFENVLCAYLKKIFTIEKNFHIFSNKIINRFKENYYIKFTTLISNIIIKKYSYYISKSFYNIKLNKTRQNSQYSHLNQTTNQSCSSLRTLFSRKTRNFCKERKTDTPINKSYDWININIDTEMKNNKRSPGIYCKSTDKKNYSSIRNDSYKNLQLENKKKLFMSKIQKEHSINFKKSKILNENNNSRINSRNNTNINYESMYNEFIIQNDTIDAQKSYRTMKYVKNNSRNDDNCNCENDGGTLYIGKDNGSKNDIYYNNNNFTNNKNNNEGCKSMRVTLGGFEKYNKYNYFNNHEDEIYDNCITKTIENNFTENSSQEINNISNRNVNYYNHSGDKKGFIRKKNSPNVIKENQNKQVYNNKSRGYYNNSNNIFTLEEIKKIQNKLKSLSMQSFDK